ISYRDDDGVKSNYDEVEIFPDEGSSGHGSVSDEESLALWERLSSKLSLKPAGRFNLDLPFQLNVWCRKLEKCELRRLCQEEVVKVNHLIESVIAGGIAGKERLECFVEGRVVQIR
ncbi:hypothetical protein L0F63_004505, partial [Massospora cicadina]